MAKEKKLYRIFISKVHRYEDHDEVFTHWKPFYRWGVSEEQVIARLRRTLNLYGYDLNDGQEEVFFKFDIEDAMPDGVRTLTVFDFDWND